MSGGPRWERVSMSPDARARRRKKGMQLAMLWHGITEQIHHGHRVVPWDQVPAEIRDLAAEAFCRMIEEGYIRARVLPVDGHPDEDRQAAS